MTTQKLNSVQVCVVAAVTLFVWTLLVWDHYHGGVPAHHILHRKDMPAMSNWWGGILLPALSLLLSYRIKLRLKKATTNGQVPEKSIAGVARGFVGAMAFGILLSVLFNLGQATLLNYLMCVLLVLLFLVPIFRSEYLLGFIIGMTVTFGGILPTAFALIVSLVSGLMYKFVRPLFLRVLKIARR